MEPISTSLVTKLSRDIDTAFEVDDTCLQSLRVYHDRYEFERHFRQSTVEVASGFEKILNAANPPKGSELQKLPCPKRGDYPTERGEHLIEMEHIVEPTRRRRFYGGSASGKHGIKDRWQEYDRGSTTGDVPSRVRKAMAEGYRIKNKYILFLIKDSRATAAEQRFLLVTIEALVSAYLWLHEDRSPEHELALLSGWDLDEYEYDGLCSHSSLADAWNIGFSGLKLTAEELQKVAMLEQAEAEVRNQWKAQEALSRRERKSLNTELQALGAPTYDARYEERVAQRTAKQLMPAKEKQIGKPGNPGGKGAYFFDPDADEAWGDNRVNPYQKYVLKLAPEPDKLAQDNLIDDFGYHQMATGVLEKSPEDNYAGWHMLREEAALLRTQHQSSYVGLTGKGGQSWPSMGDNEEHAKPLDEEVVVGRPKRKAAIAASKEFDVKKKFRRLLDPNYEVEETTLTANTGTRVVEDAELNRIGNTRATEDLRVGQKHQWVQNLNDITSTKVGTTLDTVEDIREDEKPADEEIQPLEKGATVCPVCGKKYSDGKLQNLMTWTRRHYDDEHVNKGQRQRDTFRRRWAKKAPALGMTLEQLLDPVTGRPLTVCTFNKCGRQFGNASNMQKHFRDVHILELYKNFLEKPSPYIGKGFSDVGPLYIFQEGDTEALLTMRNIEVGEVNGMPEWLWRLNKETYIDSIGIRRMRDDHSLWVHGLLWLSRDGNKVTANVKISNTGSCAGAEVVQLYIAPIKSPINRPVKELKGFKKVFVELNTFSTLDLLFDLKQATSFWDENVDKWCSHAGKYRILVGNSSDGVFLEETVEVEKTTFWTGL